MKSNFFHFPFQTKRLFRFTWICLVAMTFAQSADGAAGAQVRETDDSRAAIKEAEKLRRKGNFQDAEIVLRRITQQHPNNFKAKLSLSYVLQKQHLWHESYKISLEVAQAEPKNARAFALVGVALLNFGNFKDAELFLRNSYVLDSEESLAWFGAGMLDFYENRISESVPKLEQAEYLASDEPDYVFSLAQVLSRAEKYKEAGDAYERFLQIAQINDDERRNRIKGLINFLHYLGNKQKLYIVDRDIKQTVVPIELVNVRPVIEVRMGSKKEKFRFVLDTGSGISVISQKTAERLKLKPIARGGLARAVGGNGKFDIVYGFLKSIDIGDLKIRNVPVYIRKFHDEGDKIDGYIGLSLISKFLTTVDYGGLTFSLTRKDQASIKKFESDTLALPLRLTSSGFLSGEVLIEGLESPLNFIVDTGASISVISHVLAKTDKISQFILKEKMRVIGAAGVTENANSFLLPRVTFGSHSRERIQAVALDLGIINETSGFEQVGILGGNFLKNYCLTFDFQNSKVIFVPVVRK